MAIRFHMRPKDPVLTWNEFCADTPPFSIALDGYVSAGPRFDPTGPRANFNHHEEVDRLATRATCAQVLIAVRQGLFTCFFKDEEPTAEVYRNDCDEDICMASFILANYHIVKSAVNPILNRLVFVEDLMDTTAGAYPFPSDLPTLEELAWVFDPYRDFKVSGRIDYRIAEEFEEVVELVGDRIMQFINGRGRTKKLKVKYDKIGGGARWAMVKEIGANAKEGMSADGITAYVSVRERPDGRWAYVIARSSQFITYFDVPRLIVQLNQEEANLEAKWGSGNLHGGSSRAFGSAISPARVTEIVEEEVQSSNSRA